MDFEPTEWMENEGGATVIELREGETDLVNLQMVLVTSSMNHEYARKELEKTRSFDKKQALLGRMSHLKSLYFTARKRLSEFHPERLASLEQELRQQKQTVLSDHGLH